jgi:poly-gamma-glutamate capsule biosynthesis protein CapA/YwtB (metallophosphatase superfamily)
MDSQMSMRLALTGDSMITRSAVASRSESVAKLIELIKDVDVAFTNLEVLPNDFRGYPAVESGGTHLATHHGVLDDLVDMGFNLFSCANNHALDYSIEGLLATIEILEQKEVAYAGVGRTLAQARMPVYLDYEGGSVAMVSCSSTFAKGQSAGEQRPEVQGRPGLNPLRFGTTYEITGEQLETLHEIFSTLGLEQQWREWIQLGFAFPPEDPRIFPFVDTNLRSAGLLNARFRAADRPAVKTTPNVQDMEEIAKWTREARARADIVLVSLHAHEQDATIEDPAEFVRTFAHRIVDEGADIVVGHGPHLLRGMEIYRGSVIFYSLGNFIAQNELVHKLPADSYEYFRVDSSKTPGELFQIRHQNDQKGFPADIRFWQTVVPVCDFENGRLRRIEIVPVTLDHGQSVHRRGRPRLAKGEEAGEILARLARLSETFGTKVRHEGKSKASEIAAVEL